MKTRYFTLFFSLICCCVHAQTLSARTSKTIVDFKNAEDDLKSSFPKVIWLDPVNPTSFQKSAAFKMRVVIESRDPLKTITITTRERGEAEIHAKKTIYVPADKRFSYVLEQRVVLAGSINEIEILAENEHQLRGVARREVHVGETILADAKKLKRSDYALIMYTSKYDHWPSLANPGFDATTIAELLRTNYGFQVDMLENPSQELVWSKLKEFADRKYEPLDQVFIFVAGHGHFDESFKEGYVVLKESIPNEAGNASYISHNRLRNNINSIPCEHIFLSMDVCFGGTFDEDVANSRGVWTDPEMSQSEFILRKLAYHTRKYLTSGGKEYVSDGRPGHHSPFASKVIAALETKGGNDGILTLAELQVFTEKSSPAPLFGQFGNDAPGSEFVFVVK
ncbi:MAG TPA: caspase family protein [Chryseosolibacter sp.]